MNNKKALKSIINFLSKNNFYFCVETGDLYNKGNGEKCYCADEIYQEAHDSIYVAFVELFGGYRIETSQALTEEFQEEILNLTNEKADENHYFFNSMTTREAENVIQEQKELKQILFERFTE